MWAVLLYVGPVRAAWLGELPVSALVAMIRSGDSYPFV